MKGFLTELSQPYLKDICESLKFCVCNVRVTATKKFFIRSDDAVKFAFHRFISVDVFGAKIKAVLITLTYST